MSQDIYNANTGDITITNGSIMVNSSSPLLGYKNTNNDSTSYADIHKPTINEISGKYSNRFDDTGYY